MIYLNDRCLWDKKKKVDLCVCRMGGEEAEARFCEHKRLHMSTLRMTWEAKVQLKEILVNAGFPEGV